MSLRNAARKTVATIGDIVRSFTPGESVYMPGSSAEVPGFMDALCTSDAPPLQITSSFVPGINTVPLALMSEGTSFTSVFSHAGFAKNDSHRKFRHLPLYYSTFVRHLTERATFDSCVVHVAPPDDAGRCSLGTAVEFTPIAMSKSRRTIAVINPLMPTIPGATSVPLSDFDMVTEHAAALREYRGGSASEEAQRIAANVANLVDDGVILQIGLGKVPDALLRIVTDRRNLRLYSGMLTDGFMALSEAGALDPDWQHTTCVNIGSAAFYAWLDGRRGLNVLPCSQTHAIDILAKLPRLVAINSALSVDLFGQVNVEYLEGAMISGLGGAPDFTRGATQSAGGVSVIALPATSRNGAISRIVPALDGLCAIPRSDIHIIVTEYGSADLRDCTVIEAAERITQIAAPQHRSGLEAALRKISLRL